MSRITARSGARPLLALLAALGLLAALTMPALAEHEVNGPAVAAVEQDFPGGLPNCGAGQTGVRFGNSAEDDAPLEVNESAGGVTLTELDVDAGTASFSVEAGQVVVIAVMKGGTTQNVYDYSGFAAGGVQHDDDLVTPDNASEGPAGVSHIDFCVATATPTSTPATPTSTPATPTSTPGGAVLGGNPTPTQAAAALPNTAVPASTGVPAAILSLVLIGSLAGMAYLRIARER